MWRDLTAREQEDSRSRRRASLVCARHRAAGRRFGLRFDEAEKEGVAFGLCCRPR